MNSITGLFPSRCELSITIWSHAALGRSAFLQAKNACTKKRAHVSKTWPYVRWILTSYRCYYCCRYQDAYCGRVLGKQGGFHQWDRIMNSNAEKHVFLWIPCVCNLNLQLQWNYYRISECNVIHWMLIAEKLTINSIQGPTNKVKTGLDRNRISYCSKILFWLFCTGSR